MKSTLRGRRSVKSRTVFLRYLSMLAVLIIDISFIGMLDTLFYSNKRALILDNPKFQKMLKGKAVDGLRKRLGVARNYSSDAEYFRRAAGIIEEEAPKLFEDDSSWFRIVLYGKDEEIVLEKVDHEKFHRVNNFSNCFISQNFYSSIGLTDINLSVFYATPRGWDEIEDMVFRYWIYAALFTVVSWLVYWWIYTRAVSPLQHIGTAMETMIQGGRVTLIHRPRHEIEEAYNQLARNQREIIFGLEIDRIVDALHALSDDIQVLESFLKMIVESIGKIYPFEAVKSYCRLGNEDHFEWIESNDETFDYPFPELNNDSVLFKEDSSCCLLLSVGEQVVGALAFRVDEKQRIHPSEIQRMAQEIKKQVENGLARAFTRSQTLTEERNRFGINLATNMGHDLTNIIASGKWDLDTIQRAHGLGIVSMDEERGTFFMEAIEGLKNNLDFLQRMVDIYRSFGYTRHPRYETVDLRALVEEVAQLFGLSTSQKIRIQVMCNSEIHALVEPRLFRMAMFNLLANAAQAIQRHEENIPGIIEIHLNGEKNDLVKIEVLDNGPGIRNVNGELLKNTEVDRIFQSGYSTKASSSGGGLGLTWVKSIMEEFHQGEIHAINRSSGGAGVILTFPVEPEFIKYQ